MKASKFWDAQEPFILGKFLVFHLDCGSLDSHLLTPPH
jgi:hypothetical protein